MDRAALGRPTASHTLARHDSPTHRYAILALLGAGGTANVYRAYDRKLNREVTLKRLDDNGELGPTERASILAEARALASLNHPNVLSIYDIESTEQGLFVAAEFIAGTSLDRWLVQRDRSWVEIVELFVQAGQGLSAAHRCGLVHRDFEASNVTVSPDGQARVTDFGFVRLADELVDTISIRVRTTPSSETEEHRAGRSIPRYASPEQRSGREVDARSDQYSFCASLCDALYGTADPTLAGRRRAIPKRIHDALVRGLDPSPSQRHESMERLLVELRAGLAQRFAVRRLLGFATGSTLLVGAGMGIARTSDAPHCEATSVWTPSVRESIDRAFTETAAGYGQATAQRVFHRLDDYAAEWTLAYSRTCAALQLSAGNPTLDRRLACLRRQDTQLDALIEGFRNGVDGETIDEAIPRVASLASPGQCESLDTPAGTPPPRNDRAAAAVSAGQREVDRALANIATRKFDAARALLLAAQDRATFAEHAPFSAEVAQALGRLEDAVGHPDRALSQFATAYRFAIEGQDAERSREIALDLARMASARFGRVGAAIAWVSVADGWTLRLGPSPSREADSLAIRADLLARAGRYPEATQFYEDLLALREANGREDDPLLGDAARALGSHLVVLGEYDRAEQMLERAATIYRRSLGSAHPNVLSLTSAQGNLAMRQGDYAGAQRLYEQALERARAELPADHIALAPTMTNLGIVHHIQGRGHEALAILERALQIRKQRLGDDHPDTARSLIGWAQVVAYDPARIEEARAGYEQGLAVLRERLGPDHPDAYVPLVNLGVLLADNGDVDAAIEVQEQALAIARASFGPAHPNVGLALFNLGDYFARLHRRDEAAQAYAASLEIRSAALGPDHPDTLASMAARLQLGVQTGAMRDVEALVPTIDRRLERIGEGVPPIAPLLATTALVATAELELARQRIGSARRRLDRAMTFANASHRPDALAAVRFLAARVARAEGQRERARALARRALGDYREAGPAWSSEVETVEAWLRGGGSVREAIGPFTPP